jgi:cardiolipin synthase C
VKKPLAMTFRLFVSLATFISAVQPTLAATGTPAAQGARLLSDQDVLTASSSGNLKLTKGRLITDNDASFEQKLAIIAAAKDFLYLTYYIYSDDYSSSKFNLALIQKAQSGTKIRLLVDLLTNYSKMDLFRFLESQGNGNIEVRFYNKPSANIQTDAYYLTLPCSHENQVASDQKRCQTEKEKIVAAGQFTPQQQLMQKLYLASFYSKNGAGLKVATVGGQQLDVANAKQLAEKDKAKKDDFLSLKKLYQSAKEGSILAKLKVQSMLEQLADEIDPTLNLVTGFLPVDKIRGDHKQDWGHITDYSHQKLIMADLGDGKIAFQLGGRNIEDSYHLKTEFLKQLKQNEKQKYLFQDTDFYAEVKSGGQDMVKAFMRNWDFTEMVATTKEMDAIAPIDLPMGVAACSANPEQFEQCVGQFFMSLQTSPELVVQKATERVMAVAKNTMERAQKFEMLYSVPTQKSKYLISFRGQNNSDELTGDDLQNAMVTYIENLNSRKDTAIPKRTFGALTGDEMNAGKYISHLWQRGMENTCATEKKSQVILHSAYLLPSSSMMQTLGKMIDGSWNCRNVTIKIITNSFKTTDLNIINIFARAQMQALFDKYIGGYNENSALLSYYEYTVPAGQTQSLHTKLSVLGDDMIVGSANADVRSYYMDANNGVYLRNAKNLVADYSRFIDDLIRAGTIIEETGMFATYHQAQNSWSLKEFVPEVTILTKEFLNYWIGKTKNSEATKVKHAAGISLVQHIIEDKAKDAYLANTILLSPGKFVLDQNVEMKACGTQTSNDWGPNSCVEKEKAKGIKALDEEFNWSFQLF